MVEGESVGEWRWRGFFQMNTEGRLADREGLRCASHVPLAGDLDETFNLSEEHSNDL